MLEKFEASINLERNPTSKLINRKHHTSTSYFPQFLIYYVKHSTKILQDMLKATKKKQTTTQKNTLQSEETKQSSEPDSDMIRLRQSSFATT